MRENFRNIIKKHKGKIELAEKCKNAWRNKKSTNVISKQTVQPQRIPYSSNKDNFVNLIKKKNLYPLLPSIHVNPKVIFVSFFAVKKKATK